MKGIFLLESKWNKTTRDMGDALITETIKLEVLEEDGDTLLNKNSGY